MPNDDHFGSGFGELIMIEALGEHFHVLGAGSATPVSHEYEDNDGRGCKEGVERDRGAVLINNFS